jgi:hypothetical protein
MASPTRRSVVPIRRPRFAPTPPARGPRERLDALMRELGPKQEADPADAVGPDAERAAEAADDTRARRAGRDAPTTPKAD